MGTRGPVPKRSSERRRRNKTNEVEKVKVEPKAKPAKKKAPPKTTTPTNQFVDAEGKVLKPAAKKTWSPIARDWYESLAESGQAEFYEPSDWAAAQLVAEAMSKMLRHGKRPLSSQMFAAVWAAMTDLLTTEGARRRARIEIERQGADDEKPAEVTALDDYRQRLAASS